MVVTKTSLASVLVVLAITYNQGAARPSDTTNSVSSSSEEFESIYKIPKAITKGLVIKLNGTIDPNQLTFIVELSSKSGTESCQIKYNFSTDKKLSISPAVDAYYESTNYDLEVEPNSITTFMLTLIAGVSPQNDDMFRMTFDSSDKGQSHQLICKIDNFNNIDQIVIKQGVARVNSLLFQF